MTAESKAVPVECPRCGQGVRLTSVLKAAELGAFSLSGVQMKFSAAVVPKLYCAGDPDGRPAGEPCDWYTYGRIVGGHALFDQPLPQ